MNLIEYGEKFFDEIEIQKICKRSVSSSVALNQISSASSETLHRTVIRGVKDGRIGIYIVDSVNEQDIAGGIERAAKIAKVNGRDERWPGLPGMQNYSISPMKVPDEIESEHFVSELAEALRTVRMKSPTTMVVGGESGATWLSTSVENSNGVSVEQRDFSSFFVMVMVGRQGQKVTPSIFDMDVSKSTELDTHGVVDRCLDKLKVAMNVKRAELSTSSVLLEPFALAELLSFAMFPAFSGERQVKGTSVLAGREGERVMSEKITIADDPFHPSAISRVIADDEGVATRKTMLVENGVMRGFLWNHYWASMAGKESTGNALRNFRSGALGIGAHNMVIAPGSRKVEDIIADMKHGYIVSSFQGAHSSNPDTGDISVVSNPAFVVEDGQITGSTVFMLSGNIYELMNNVGELSREQRAVFMGMMGKGIYPSVQFEDVKIAPVSR